jgi:hypothetical protein
MSELPWMPLSVSFCPSPTLIPHHNCHSHIQASALCQRTSSTSTYNSPHQAYPFTLHARSHVVPFPHLYDMHDKLLPPHHTDSHPMLLPAQENCGSSALSTLSTQQHTCFTHNQDLSPAHSCVAGWGVGSTAHNNTTHL